ncbi:MAG: transcriptional repressor [Candidatus Brocadiia bacterium]
MSAGSTEIDERMDAFETACRQEGLRRTPQRLAVFREVASNEEHPSVDAIYERVRRKLPTISRDTVYRTLWLLESKGLLSTVAALHERVRFDPNTDQHHHFICTSCGTVRDFYSDELDEFEPPETVREWGRIDTFQGEVRGVCNDCLARGQEDVEQ